MTNLDLDPARTALLTMDYQNGIVGMVPDADTLLDAANKAIFWFREQGAHVGYVRVAFTDADFDAIPAHAPMAKAVTPERRQMMHADAETTAIHEKIAPRSGDIVVRKTRVGPFSTTDLEAQLRDRGVNTLVLAGISTSGVVLSTVRAAADMDYRLVVLSDACADTDEEKHRVLLERVFPMQASVVTTAELIGS